MRRVKRAGVPARHRHGAWMSRKPARLPGVAAVLTAEDIPGEHNHGLVIYDWPVLVGVGERVRYVGDAVAIVAAETREIATQALDLIEVEFEPQPVISDPVQARQPGCPCAPPERKSAQAYQSAQRRHGAGFCRGGCDPGAHLPHRHHRPCLPGAGVQHCPA